MFKLFISIAFILLIQTNIYGNRGIPFIKHFNYYCPGSARQNWTIAQAPNGFMYFGNNRGLLEYDGKTWKIYKTSNETIIRSLCIDPKGHIYTGTTNEFGFFESNNNHPLSYTCLSDIFNIDDCGIIWDIVYHNNAVYFISYKNRIFKYDENVVEEIIVPPTFKRFKGFLVDNNFLLFDTNAGLAILKNDTIYRFHTETFNYNDLAYSILSSNENKIIIGTRYNGLYIFDMEKHKHLDYEQSHTKETIETDIDVMLDPDNSLYYIRPVSMLNEELSDKELYHGIKLANGKIVYATLKGGIFITDQNGYLIDNLRYNRGLPDNSVFYVYEDNEYNLWVAEEKGISLIEVNDSFRTYNNDLGIEGTIIRSAIIDDKLFIGTTAGLYFIDHTNSDSKNYGLPELLTKDVIYLSNLHQYQDKYNKGIIFSSLNGTYFYDIYTNKLTGLFHQHANYAIAQHPLDSSLFFYSHSDGITILRKKNEYEWDFDTIGNILEDYNEIRRLHFNPQGNQLYVSSLYTGLILVDFPNKNNLLKHNIVTYDKSNGLPTNDRNKWFFTNDTIIVATRQGIYITPSMNDLGEPDLQFVSFDVINNQLDMHESHIVSITADGDDLLLGTKQGILSFNQNTQLISRDLFHRTKEMEINNMDIDENGRLWIVTSEALIYRDIKSIRNVMQKPSLYFSEIIFGNDSVLTIRNNKKIDAGTFPFKNNSLIVKTAFPSYCNSENNRFMYFVEGLDKSWSNWSYDHKYSISYIPAGSYTLKIKAINGQQEESDIIKLAFSISPPWYSSKTAWFLYLLIIISFVTLIIKLYTSKLDNDKKRLKIAIKAAVTEVEQQKKEITDSIIYARQIQKAMLQSNYRLSELFPSNFVINRPKDIVSGDFFWCYGTDNYKIVVVADCTGHGVPGAFVSMIIVNFLKEIVIGQRCYMPDKILNYVRDNIIASLHQTGDVTVQNDGMDVAIVTIDKKEEVIYYAGANNAIFVMNEHKLTIYPPNKMPVGIYYTIEPFSLTTIPINKLSNIYMLSDGFLDQFGKKTDRRFTTKRFTTLLQNIQHMEMHQQKEFIEVYFQQWKGDTMQYDDILVVGIQVTA